MRFRKLRASAGAIVVAATLMVSAGLSGTASAQGNGHPGSHHGSATTTTPIKHLVVIFQENVSFDHYFATYPAALNPPGEPAFHAVTGTPTVNGLSGALLTNNPNLANPQRLDRDQALTCDQDHAYGAEQEAFDHGLMDMFVQHTGTESGGAPLTLAQCLASVGNKAPVTGASPNYAVMDYYDGNTVTALWNYAQHFAMSDNSYGTNFGPSTPGALNVTSAQTFGALCGPKSAVYDASPCTPVSLTSVATTTPLTSGATTLVPPGPGSVYSDADPLYDVCSATVDGSTAASDIAMGGPNIGTALDAAHVTWGWFQGGFASPGYVPGRPRTDQLSQVCTGSHRNIGGAAVTDYIPHHEPFQYYAATANPLHKPPTSVAMVGRQDQANHQYDLRDFFAAAKAGNLPAVSFLKAAAYQDGHAGYSDPLDEQTWLVNTINFLEKLPSWRSTAVVINWDDSDGWYDHQLGPIIRQSQTDLDALTGTGMCGSDPAKVPVSSAGTPEEARCGVGPRLPMLVISPYAKRNFVDGTFSTQSSVVQFIEDNWLNGQRLGDGAADAETGTIDNMFDFYRAGAPPLFLNPATGEPLPF